MNRIDNIDTDQTRRGFLSVIAGGAAAYLGWTWWDSDGFDAGGGGGGGGTVPRPRFQSLSPLPGSAAITIEASDGYGTVAGGVEGPDGEEWIVTNRHVVDPEYPDSDEEDVIGTMVYDLEDREIGEVVDVGDSKGAGATDWAVVGVGDSEVWTARVLGLPTVSGQTDVSIGDRIIMSGARTGIVSGEVTNTGIDTNWRGTLLENVFEYRVDESIDTNGNSGSWVGVLDENGELAVAGVHTFSDGDDRYAIPVDDVTSGSGANIVSDGELPDGPLYDNPSIVEGGVLDGQVIVANIGSEEVQERTIELREDGDVVDSETVSLDPFEEQVLSMDFTHPVTLDTGDVERSTE